MVWIKFEAVSQAIFLLGEGEGWHPPGLLDSLGPSLETPLKSPPGSPPEPIILSLTGPTGFLLGHKACAGAKGSFKVKIKCVYTAFKKPSKGISKAFQTLYKGLQKAF